MSTPFVSVILPTYNRSRTLGRAIDGVLAQSYRDFELIVVDDGSTDGTEGLLAAVADSRLRVIKGSQRRGAAHARNAGIRAARGQLVAFQDSDDEWLPGKLECQVGLLESGPDEVGWVGGAYLVDSGTTRREVRSRALERGDDYDGELFIGEPFVTPTWLVRRKSLLDAGLFDETMPCLEDWDLIFKLASRCRFRSVADVILVRHASADSLFSDIAKRKAGLEVMLTRHRERWQRQPHQYARWCTELGRLHGLQGARGACRAWLYKSLQARPFQLGAVGLYAATLLGRAPLKRLSRSRLAAAG